MVQGSSEGGAHEPLADGGETPRPQGASNPGPPPLLCFAMASMPPRLGPSGITALTPALYRSWAQLFKRVYEADSLVCPACGGEMRIIAFIIDHDVVDAILRHLAKAETQSPRGPPGTAAVSAAS